MLKKYYGLDVVFNIFDEIDDSRYKLRMYIPMISNTINRKNEMLEYLKLIELKLNDVLSTPSVVRKIGHAKYKGM